MYNAILQLEVEPYYIWLELMTSSGVEKLEDVSNFSFSICENKI